MIFLALFIVLGQRMVDVNKDKTTETTEAVLNMVNDEIKLAQTVDDGYFRQFRVPRNIIGQEFNLSLDDFGLLTLTLGDKEYSKYLDRPMKGGFCFPNPLPEGYFDLTVQKVNGVVSLSSCDVCDYPYAVCANAEADGLCAFTDALLPGFNSSCCTDHCKCCPP